MLLFSKINDSRNLICSPQAFNWMHALNILGGKYKYVTLNVLSFLYQAHLKSKAGKMRKSLQIITQRGSSDVKCCFCFVAQCRYSFTCRKGVFSGSSCLHAGGHLFPSLKTEMLLYIYYILKSCRF